jgi:hypothetical protein
LEISNRRGREGGETSVGVERGPALGLLDGSVVHIDLVDGGREDSVEFRRCHAGSAVHGEIRNGGLARRGVAERES